MASASRFVPLQLPLAEFIEEQANKNTLSKTNRDVSLLKEFLRAKEIDKELENIEAKVLDEILCTFIVEVKKKDGGEYEPTTLRSFISSFDRYFWRKRYPTTIIDGQEFRKTRETLVAKQKELKKAGKGNKTKSTRALTDEEVDILYGKELLGLSSPESLLNTLWLNNTQHFGLRGCQEHRDMTWGDVQLKASADGVQFLEYTERQTKTRTGAEPKDTRAVKPKMFSVPSSDRDPVKAYHLYASKRPEQMNSADSPFYLAVNYTKLTQSSKPWFKAAPMGINKLNSLMKTMDQKGGLHAENLTNHSARKRMIQKLNDQEVPPTHIMQVSGHKNVQSLNNYSSLSEKQQRDISNILSASTSGSLAIRQTEEVSLSSRNQQSPQRPFSLFQGAKIQGGTFNIAINSLSQQSPDLSFHCAKRKHYFIESDSD